MDPNARVYVAGHRGLVGSALWRALEQRGFRNLIGRTRAQLDLLDGEAVRRFFDAERPEYVLLAAARVGGIRANAEHPADFLLENLQIECHVIHQACQTHVRKLLFLGSSCIYPKFAPQPIPEDALLTGLLEPTNEPYALAKIAGLKLCQAYRRQYGCDFISAMPTNLYGPNDNYHPDQSHVLPALIRRFHEAQQRNQTEVTCWGTGTPRREFLHADDLASACLFLMEHYSDDRWINVGSSQEITIRELAERVARTVGFTGQIRWDPTRPDGTPRKLLDSSRLAALGWTPGIALDDGLRGAYNDFLQRRA